MERVKLELSIPQARALLENIGNVTDEQRALRAAVAKLRAATDRAFSAQRSAEAHLRGRFTIEVQCDCPFHASGGSRFLKCQYPEEE